jgi:serine/threonine protein kinase
MRGATPRAVSAKVTSRCGASARAGWARYTALAIPRLGRDVAIKILPRAFTSDPDRLARFEREARVLASLNHPNIATIYGIEEGELPGPAEAGHYVRGLVMELVEGETLAERISRGPIRVADAAEIDGRFLGADGMAVRSSHLRTVASDPV